MCRALFFSSLDQRRFDNHGLMRRTFEILGNRSAVFPEPDIMIGCVLREKSEIIAPLQVPDGLKQLDRTSALTIPAQSPDVTERQEDDPCLERVLSGTFYIGTD